MAARRPPRMPNAYAQPHYGCHQSAIHAVMINVVEMGYNARRKPKSLWRESGVLLNRIDTRQLKQLLPLRATRSDPLLAL